jgi:hypothetical protein
MMEGSSTETDWTTKQPGRGIFALAVTIGLAFTISAAVDIQMFNGMFTFITMSMVPSMAVIGLVWGGQYPPTQNLHQAWRGLALTLLTLTLGTIYCIAFLRYRGGWVVQPFVAIALITSIVTVFFLIIGFGTWPWHKMSPPAQGLMTLITAFVLGAWVISSLYNFDFLSYPTGVKPSPIPSVPFYSQGGPLAAFTQMAPHGPIPWEWMIAYMLWIMVPMWILVHTGMWPISKFPGLMKQPIMGIVFTLICCIIGYVALKVGIDAMSIEPLKFLVIGISYIFGLLMLLTVFQTWPGRTMKQPLGGLVNAIVGIPLGIVGYYGVLAFCNWHFGVKAMVYPNNMFAIGGVMLGITFPVWVLYTGFWDFWPLPPTPPPPDAGGQQNQ